jgi:methylated-DNA-protein-cysteine methyltransferase-like protein
MVYILTPQAEQSMDQQDPTPLYQRIYSLVRQIPPGYVSSYGRIGQRAGCTARTVGFALAALPAGNDVPWQRVVNRQGRISCRDDGGGHVLQRDLLELEGICFDEKEGIDLNVYEWIFDDSPETP